MITRYIDTNILVYPVLFTDSRARACRELLEEIVAQKVRALTSVLTWDEFVYVIQRTLGRDVAVKEGRQLLRFPHLRFVDADMEIVIRSQELIAQYAIQPRDALHAATAILRGAEEFASVDDDFDGIPGIRRMPVR